MKQFILQACFLLSTIFLTCFQVQAQTVSSGDWPWWRGPHLNNVSEADQNIPLQWNESKNILWKVKVPGRGHASPTIVGDHIFLATADERGQRQAVVAFNRSNGKQLWLTEISQGGFPKTHSKNTHATPTVACDGQQLLVTFHHHDTITLAALDLDGHTLWTKDLGTYAPRLYEYGYAPSPLIDGENVIVSADYEGGGFITAHQCKSGEQVWKIDRPKMLSFSSPVIANIAGKRQLLISGCEMVASYDPASGTLNWSVPGTTMATCGTMVWDGDLVFASGGYPDPQTICVKGDGSGKVLWTNKVKCYEQSMLATAGYVYALSDQGIAYCWRASDGQEMWKQRLSGPVSSSPVLVGEHILATVENGMTYVFKANPEKYEAVSRNKLGEEGFATMAVCNNRIYIRTATGTAGRRQEWLYCIGQE